MKRIKQHWFRLMLHALITLPLTTFLVALVCLLVFIFWPSPFKQFDSTPYTTEANTVTITAHGMKDSIDGWSGSLTQALAIQHPATYAVAVDWHRWATNPLRCAVNGKRIGERVGLHLAANPHLKRAHLIGHSCGAFVIYGACKKLKQIRPDILVQTTYLDPVSIYGPLMDYGIEHFGRCADYSDAFIDHEDSVHGSNAMLPNTHTYDVTALRPNGVRPHVWPPLYYSRLLLTGEAPLLSKDHLLRESKPAGVMETVQP